MIRLEEIIYNRKLSNGLNTTGLPYVNIYCSANREIEMPQTDNMYLYLIVEGILRLYTPSGSMDYESEQYFVSAIDTPEVGYIFATAKEQRFSAVSVEFNPSDVISIVLELDNDLIKRISKGIVPKSAMEASDNKIVRDVSRLLEAADDPIDRMFLGCNIRREILFHVLCGKSGTHFLESVIRLQNSEDIYEANTWIKENYRKPFTVDELAKKFNMSVSAFHDKFRSAVGMAPLQCQKRLKLTEARRLMLDYNKNVSQAAVDVGYDNFSQFIREYRKMFGFSPKDDIRRMKRLADK